MLKVTHSLTLPDALLEVRTGKAGGPGGQHVNTTDSAVQLRFDARQAREQGLLHGAVFTRLRAQAGSRMTKDGVVLIDAAEARSQHRNRELADHKLIELLRAALARPKKRIPTRPSRAAKRRRLDNKTQRGRLKRQRRTPSQD